MKCEKKGYIRCSEVKMDPIIPPLYVFIEVPLRPRSSTTGTAIN